MQVESKSQIECLLLLFKILCHVISKARSNMIGAENAQYNNLKTK